MEKCVEIYYREVKAYHNGKYNLVKSHNKVGLFAI